MKRGFILEIVEVDGQFEPLRCDLAEMGITLNKCSREEHVPVPERRIQTLKERCRCICNTLPFTKLPGQLVVQMVSTCNFWLNVYPPKDGVSREINPRELITGVKIDYNKHIRAGFGDYVQVHEEHDNSMQTRTTGAIATKPTGNAQGGFWFYSLTTGRMLDRTRWTALPMPQDVIARVNVLARRNPVGLTWTNMRNEAVYDIDDEDDSDDDSDDSDYDSDNEEDDDDNYDDFIAGVDIPNVNPPDPPDENENVDENQQNENDDDDEQEDNEEDDVPTDTINNNNGDEEQEQAEAEAPVITTLLKKLTDTAGALPPIIESRTRQKTPNNSVTLVTGTTEEEQKPEQLLSHLASLIEEWKIAEPLGKKKRKLERELQKQMLKRAEEEKNKRLKNKLRNEKRRMKIKERNRVQKATTGEEKKESDEYGDLRDQLKSEQKPGVSFPHDSCSSKNLTPELEAIALTQYTLKKGLKEFGDDGRTALGKEIEQLYTRKVSKPVDGNNLTREQNRASLRYLMFLTKKRCGRIKARGCADGRKQRETTSKEEASKNLHLSPHFFLII